MHLNYHFLRFLCPQLDRTLRSMELLECFSQNKDELVMGFASAGADYYIRAHLSPANPCLSFLPEYKRSKKNSVDLFPELIHQSVASIEVIPYERAFKILFRSGQTLLFKLHGSRSNILYYQKEGALPAAIFRNELKEDHSISIHTMARPLDLSKEEFVRHEGKAATFLPTLGKIPREWLKEHGYLDADLEKKWSLMQEIIDMLESPLYNIIKKNDTYFLSLLPEASPVFSTSDPIRASNEYFQYAIVHQAFEKEKQQLTKTLEDQKKKTLAYIQKTTDKLHELTQSSSPSQTADVIMANLHQIPAGAEEVELFDFYQNQNISIKLKRGTSPQKHAENLYRKAKNRKIEIRQLESNLADKENHYLELEEKTNELSSIQKFKELREFAKSHGLAHRQKESTDNQPFKRFEKDGYDILVGKSAKANDLLLRYYSWKDDLWLHAKDVTGSHVLIKQKPGTNIPKSTLERAAELAAYYSKSKNETLAAVIYTPCKYVRKVKGAAAGAVMVDQEKVIMVTPKGPDRDTDG